MRAASRVRAALRRWSKRRVAEGEHRRLASERKERVAQQRRALGLTLGDGARHILFVVVDCLRADHLSLHGYPAPTTPHLDEWARRSWHFADALAPSCWTYPSVASLLTGLYPHHHGAAYAEQLRNFNARMMPRRLRDDALTLPDLLGALGWATYLGTGIATAELALRGRFQTARSLHLADASQLFDDYSRWRSAQGNVPTCGYIQLSNLHDPISVPSAWRETLGPLDAVPRLEHWQYLEDPRPGDPDFVRYRANRIKLYDAALRYVDECFHEFLLRLAPPGHAPVSSGAGDTLVIFTADHGEEMWEHTAQEREHFYDPRPAYGAGHAHNLWQELIHVPLILHGPGISPRADSRPASLVDVFPTVLQLAGVRGAERLTLDSLSLLGDVPLDRARLAEDVSFGYEKKAVVMGNHKLLVSEGDGVEWVFDLAADPGEENFKLQTSNLKELRAHLPRGEEATSGEAVTADEETVERLRALGYIE